MGRLLRINIYEVFYSHCGRGVGDGAGDLDDVVELRVLAVDPGQVEDADFAQALCLVVENRRRLEAAPIVPSSSGLVMPLSIFPVSRKHLGPLTLFVKFRLLLDAQSGNFACDHVARNGVV